MNTVATNRKLRLLITGIKSETLVPNPDFQRRLVWSNKHKLAFLDTVLNGYPFPEIYIAAGEVNSETAEGVEMLVDGQQRITTLYEYFTASPTLRLSGSIKPYADLPKAKKDAFLEYEVVVRDLGKMSVLQIKEVFQRINSTQYGLNAMEIHNARFDGAFKAFAEQVAQLNFFERHQVFKPSDVRRMHDLRFILVFLVTVLAGYSNRDDELEDYLEKYNDEFEIGDELLGEINGVLAWIDDCALPEGSRAWKKADIFTLLVEAHSLIYKEKQIENPTVAGERLRNFYSQVENVSRLRKIDERVTKYYKASIQATNDRGNRIIRGQIIHDIILGVQPAKNEGDQLSAFETAIMQKLSSGKEGM